MYYLSTIKRKKYITYITISSQQVSFDLICTYQVKLACCEEIVRCDTVQGVGTSSHTVVFDKPNPFRFSNLILNWNFIQAKAKYFLMETLQKIILFYTVYSSLFKSG